jgi:hypothetical protein
MLLWACTRYASWRSLYGHATFYTYIYQPPVFFVHLRAPWFVKGSSQRWLSNKLIKLYELFSRMIVSDRSCGNTQTQIGTYRTVQSSCRQPSMARKVTDDSFAETPTVYIDFYTPFSPFFAHSRNSFFFSFPVLVFGSSATMLTSLGTMKRLMLL